MRVLIPGVISALRLVCVTKPDTHAADTFHYCGVFPVIIIITKNTYVKLIVIRRQEIKNDYKKLCFFTNKQHSSNQTGGFFINMDFLFIWFISNFLSLDCWGEHSGPNPVFVKEEKHKYSHTNV